MLDALDAKLHLILGPKEYHRKSEWINNMKKELYRLEDVP